jgi:hypothetical protein
MVYKAFHIITQIINLMKESFTCTHLNCGKSYINKSILKRHVQAIHNTSKKFQCSLCGKSLASRQNLKEHIYIHTGEKPYKCLEPGCDAAFRQGTHLSAHKRFEHGNSESSNGRGFVLINNVKIDLLTSLLGQVLDCKMYKFLLAKQPKIKLRPVGNPHVCTLPNLFGEVEIRLT